MENSWQLFLSGRVAEAYQQCEERHEDSPKSFFIRAYCLRYGFGVKKNVSEAVNNCMRVYESEDDELEPRIADMRVLTLGEIVGGALRILGSMFLGGVIGTLLLQTPIFDGYLLRDDKWIFGLSGIGVVFGCALAFRYIRMCFPSQMKRRIRGIVAFQSRTKDCVAPNVDERRPKNQSNRLRILLCLCGFGLLGVGYFAAYIQVKYLASGVLLKKQSNVRSVIDEKVAFEFGRAMEKLRTDTEYAPALELLGENECVDVLARINSGEGKQTGSLIATYESATVIAILFELQMNDSYLTVKFPSLKESILDAIANKDKD